MREKLKRFNDLMLQDGEPINEWIWRLQPKTEPPQDLFRFPWMKHVGGFLSNIIFPIVILVLAYYTFGYDTETGFINRNYWFSIFSTTGVAFIFFMSIDNGLDFYDFTASIILTLIVTTIALGLRYLLGSLCDLPQVLLGVIFTVQTLTLILLYSFWGYESFYASYAWFGQLRRDIHKSRSQLSVFDTPIPKLRKKAPLNENEINGAFDLIAREFLQLQEELLGSRSKLSLMTHRTDMMLNRFEQLKKQYSLSSLAGKDAYAFLDEDFAETEKLLTEDKHRLIAHISCLKQAFSESLECLTPVKERIMVLQISHALNQLKGEAQTHHARITREIIDSALAFQTGVESFGCLLNQTIKRTGVETAVAESKDDLLFNIQRMRTIIKEFVDESQNLVDSLPHVA
ncbi:hypothetical protein COT97_04480 [Candidatus Falkowbacteria bacterium CG10_big_fil_rev_8_21_14_0_10_39_11]|uniref:Uncharacterized protein n=1 Tax=Candidatus Falkowbacteria bacterium CG10_big_fil_rev_8_21_14_0_10_39_11 TaxID=1974565 RepID=A0A2H0V3Z1_9BACT|nr:MAG: hypothetical protein COT97_04480 [Candidatus Falkowbacteria bacterium CG10_big_fil_rev_8_21_14_0_10_39_11]